MQLLRPSFFIIGERKCGTSSLYRYLVAHPNVLPCQLKEPNFFGKGVEYVHQNIGEYWQLFPQKEASEAIQFEWPELNKAGILYHETVKIEREDATKYITGEASVNTFYEVNPQLVQQYLPTTKLIVLFRNPVERAFSHHRMFQRFQAEGRDLGFKVNDFATDILAEMELIKKGGKGPYLSPSIYLPTLKNWITTFGKDQIRVYFAEDLAELEMATNVMEDIQTYLSLPFFDYKTILQQRFNVAPKAEMDREIKEKLQFFFKGYNQQLAEFLNCTLPKEWEYL
ncbi:MAG: sulfotransferase [Saprospiraceae bacterium]